MRKVLIAMAVMFLLVIFPGISLWAVLSHLIGGGVSETYLYPIYGGIILLAGLIVGCTVVVLNAIESLKEDIKKHGSDKE